MEYIKISMARKYAFLTAGNGKEALKILEKHKVDLLVSDIMMPEVDGLSLCERVKTNPQYSNIPVILLTAMAMASNEVDGLRAGADAYITKPFDINVLEARFESLLSRNQKVDEYIKRRLIVENQIVEVESYSEKLLQETIQFINKHISDPEINIDKMCKEIGISHSSLYRKVKLQTGMTLNELTRSIKLKKAAQLIKSKKYSIAEIMDETGFTNHSYFAKCFKNEYNMSPREYAEKK
jgi:YesN/AraC family two-component response regulator